MSIFLIAFSLCICQNAGEILPVADERGGLSFSFVCSGRWVVKIQQSDLTKYLRNF